MNDDENSKSNDQTSKELTTETSNDEVINQSILNDVEEENLVFQGNSDGDKLSKLEKFDINNFDVVLTMDDTELHETENNSKEKVTTQDQLNQNQITDSDNFEQNQLNISNNYYSENINLNNLSLKNNLNKFETNTGRNFSNSCENLNKNNLNTQISYSSSLSSSYSNLNSNQIKLSNSDEIDLKFESLSSSIEDNSKSTVNFSSTNKINSNDLSDSTILITSSTLTNNEAHSAEDENDAISNNLRDFSTQAYLWTDTEALIKQHEQSGPSACGETAILNVLKALNFDYDYEHICSQVKINSRIPESEAGSTTLGDYLLSRSVAGMNSFELIENIERVTNNRISGQFFPFYPPRDVNLPSWLAYWLRKKAVPVALLNLQKTPVWGFIPDAWHHQMIYACDSNNVYLTNPLETKSIETITNELTSESVLLVRSYDVIKRFNANSMNLIDLINLRTLSKQERKRWLDINVIGQVLSILREAKNCQEIGTNGSRISVQVEDTVETSENGSILSTESLSSTVNSIHHNNNSSLPINSSVNNSSLSHVTIPASYKSGICLFTYKESDLFKEICEANDLPLLQKN